MDDGPEFYPALPPSPSPARDLPCLGLVQSSQRLKCPERWFTAAELDPLRLRMTDSRVAQRPALPADPVGSIIGELMEARAAASHRRNLVVLPLLVAACVAAWAAPALVPPQAEALTPATVENGARLNLYLASLQVREYLATHRTLPATLDEAGGASTGIAYVRGAGSYFELSTTALGARMVYRSSVPDSVFLGRQRVRGIR